MISKNRGWNVISVVNGSNGNLKWAEDRLNAVKLGWDVKCVRVVRWSEV
jgi:hypothetical protein